MSKNKNMKLKPIKKGIRIIVTGDYAIFNHTELSVDNCSYDVITPYAARSIWCYKYTK